MCDCLLQMFTPVSILSFIYFLEEIVSGATCFVQCGLGPFSGCYSHRPEIVFHCLLRVACLSGPLEDNIFRGFIRGRGSPLRQ